MFAKNPKTLSAFYVKAFGLEVASEEGAFIDLEAGGFRIAFHKAVAPTPGSHKLSFYAKEVEAAIQGVASSGATMRKPRGGPGELWFCDGKDPEGNSFQVSNRK